MIQSSLTTSCKNCKHIFEGNFCNQCGQSSNTRDINFHSILHEIQHGIFHIDKGILYTTKKLFTKPGHAIRDYLYGKRINHFKPFAYILILSTIYALLNKIFNKNTFLDQFLSGMTEGFTDPSKKRLSFLPELLIWLKEHYAYTTLLFLPIISFASYLSFLKSKFNYFQHLILNSFIAGQQTVVFLLLLPVTYFMTDKELNDDINTFKVFTAIFLTFWSYYQFFDKSTALKKISLTILTFILMGIFFVIIAFVFLLATSYFNK